MESYQAMRMVIGADTVLMAKRLGRSTSLLHKWSEPHTDFEQSGAMNPLDRLEILIETAQANGRADDEALAPAHWLAQRFDCLLLPPLPRHHDDQVYTRWLCKAVKESGEAFSAAAEALADGKLTAYERRAVSKELHHAMASLAAFTRLVESKS